MSAQNALQDKNDKFSLLVQQGSAGTAAAEGTAETMRVGGNPITGAMYVEDLSGGSGTTNVSILNGTVNRVHSVGTIDVLPNLPGGSVVVTAIPQISVGTLPNLPGGSVAVTSIPQVSVGTIPQVSVGTIPNIPGGTIGLVTRVGNVGTLEVGTISTLPNIPGGTIGVVSSVTNLVAGTLTALANGTVTAGTINNVGTVPGVGVVTSITNVAGGTVKLNPNPSIWDNTYGTTSAGTIGTIVAAPSAGSAIIIDALSVNQISGTAEVLVSFGLAANGNGVVTRGLYPAGGGESKNYGFPVGGSTTGSALTWNILSGSGTVSYSVAYRILVP